MKEAPAGGALAGGLTAECHHQPIASPQDTQKHALGVDIRYLQRDDLGDAQASAVSGAERGLILRLRGGQPLSSK